MTRYDAEAEKDFREIVKRGVAVLIIDAPGTGEAVRFRGMPARFETASGNPRLNAVIIEADDQSGSAIEIERISYSQEELADLANLK